MKRNTSIKLKAALLLTVFALNTLVGFACAVGVDMGFNNTHHPDGEVKEIHVHANGEKHEHLKKKAKHQQEKNNKEKKEKGGCCSDKVIKIYQTDKTSPQSNTILSPVFFTAFISIFHNADVLYLSKINTSTRYFVSGHHPPIPDIRIAIQSFQI